MMLNLGSRRLVAADDYRNTTNSYTGIRVDVRTPGGVTATAIYVLPQIRLPDELSSARDAEVHWDRESFDLQLWGILAARPNTIAGATFELGYFGLSERDWAGHPTRNRDLDTFSARVIREPKAGIADFELEGAYQTGSVRTGTAMAAPQQDVAAWFLHADVGFLLPGKAKLRLSVEYDRASGDAPGGKYGRFDTLFGMRRPTLPPPASTTHWASEHQHAGTSCRDRAERALGRIRRLSRNVAGGSNRCFLNNRHPRCEWRFDQFRRPPVGGTSALLAGAELPAR